MTLRTARVTYSKRTPPIPAVRKREAIERESMTEQPADSTLTTEKKLSLNWHSNAPWAPTGYGNQTKVFVPRIKDLGYPVSITAFYGLQGGRMWLNDGTVVYPVGNHPYGQDILGAHAMHSGANAIITLMDAWVVQPENALWYSRKTRLAYPGIPGSRLIANRYRRTCTRWSSRRQSQLS